MKKGDRDKESNDWRGEGVNKEGRSLEGGRVTGGGMGDWRGGVNGGGVF